MWIIQADDSYEMSRNIFSDKWKKKKKKKKIEILECHLLQILLDALRVNMFFTNVGS